MAFWGVRFLLRINLVTGCICLRGGVSRCGRDAERTHSLTAGNIPLKTVSKFTTAAASAGLRIEPRPPHKCDGETALRACWVSFPRLRRSRTGAGRQRATMKRGRPKATPWRESDL